MTGTCFRLGRCRECGRIRLLTYFWDDKDYLDNNRLEGQEEYSKLLKENKPIYICYFCAKETNHPRIKNEN